MVQTKNVNQLDKILQDSTLGQWYGMDERIVMTTKGGEVDGGQ